MAPRNPVLLIKVELIKVIFTPLKNKTPPISLLTWAMSQSPVMFDRNILIVIISLIDVLLRKEEFIKLNPKPEKSRQLLEYLEWFSINKEFEIVMLF